MLLTNKTETTRVPAGARAANVAQLARIRLAASAYPALRQLDCCFHEGALTVRGRVSTFHERQMAWIVLCDLADVEEFVDQVEVIVPVIKTAELDGLIVACKAARLNWSTTTMIIRHRPGCPAVTNRELEQAKAAFDALSLSVAQRTIRLW